MMTTMSEFHILAIANESGVSISVHKTDEDAKGFLYQYVSDWWNDVERYWYEGNGNDEVPDIPDDIDSAISQYFSTVPGECYEIVKYSDSDEPDPGYDPREAIMNAWDGEREQPAT